MRSRWPCADVDFYDDDKKATMIASFVTVMAVFVVSDVVITVIVAVVAAASVIVVVGNMFWSFCRCFGDCGVVLRMIVVVVMVSNRLSIVLVSLAAVVLVVVGDGHQSGFACVRRRWAGACPHPATSSPASRPGFWFVIVRSAFF